MLPVSLAVGRDEETDLAELYDETYSLQQEILQLDIEDAVRASGGAVPPGAKGGAVDATELIVTLATSGVLTALLATVQAWIRRDEHREVTLRLGDVSVDVKGLGEDGLRDVLDMAERSGAWRRTDAAGPAENG